MIQIRETLVSDDLLEKEFVCNLQQCKGACCVVGEAGAPLTEVELERLDRDYDHIAPYLPSKGRQAIAAQGKYVKGWDDDWETPIIDGKECVYTVFDSNGHASCGIEKAYLAGKSIGKNPSHAIYILFGYSTTALLWQSTIINGKFVVRLANWDNLFKFPFINL